MPTSTIEQTSAEHNDRIIDNLDLRILELMVHGYDNKQISNATKIPLSTVQRRARNMLQKGIF